jgi:hypothetical protein
MQRTAQGRVAHLEGELEKERGRRLEAEARLGDLATSGRSSEPARTNRAESVQTVPGTAPSGAPGSPERRVEALRRRDEVHKDMWESDAPPEGEPAGAMWRWQRRYPPSTAPPPQA